MRPSALRRPVSSSNPSTRTLPLTRQPPSAPPTGAPKPEPAQLPGQPNAEKKKSFGDEFTDQVSNSPASLRHIALRPAEPWEQVIFEPQKLMTSGAKETRFSGPAPPTLYYRLIRLGRTYERVWIFDRPKFGVRELLSN